ncbi:hypothetical protein [Streptomyces mirabilis]|nr:hypothetical protein [Streptomyces mirabilis]
MTDRWGVTPRPDGSGKTVWFECLAKAPDELAKGVVSLAPPPAPNP